MTQIVLTDDNPLKRTEEERLAEEQRLRGGQPRKLVPDVDTLNTVRGLAMISATMHEAAEVLNVSEKTFATFLNTFTAAREAWTQGYAMGNRSLRRAQFDRAITDKSDTMLIWLGKNRLGQSDKREVTHQHAVKPIDLTADQQQAAERYAQTMSLPPALRLIAPPTVIEGEAEAVPDQAEADMSPPETSDAD